ncbi:transposase [Falsigemmobacter faecalis]|uniref:Transposase n=1 Tax=Falsigemmobacter faecalis TaxID=2488730 RepID=A0A3P3D5H6_9RHOB|nr:transposase [Falsigemmobacter faecalis]
MIRHVARLVKPQSIRADNGPEYISSTLMIWAEKQGIALNHIQPGKLQQNAYVQRYRRTVRHDWLDLYIFDSIKEVQTSQRAGSGHTITTVQDGHRPHDDRPKAETGCVSSTPEPR